MLDNAASINRIDRRVIVAAARESSVAGDHF
jgi:hypothetical protein